MSVSFEYIELEAYLNIKFVGEMLSDSIERDLTVKVDKYIDGNDKANCLIDLSELKFMNSSGITVLIKLLTKFRNKGGELVLINPSEHINKLLLMTKINEIFTIVSSEEEALKIFTS